MNTVSSRASGRCAQGRSRRFPAVQYRGIGEFNVTRSRDITVTNRCACFMCGKKFAKRHHLKKHFSACAKEQHRGTTEISEAILENGERYVMNGSCMHEAKHKGRKRKSGSMVTGHKQNDTRDLKPTTNATDIASGKFRDEKWISSRIGEDKENFSMNDKKDAHDINEEHIAETLSVCNRNLDMQCKKNDLQTIYLKDDIDEVCKRKRTRKANVLEENPKKMFIAEVTEENDVKTDKLNGAVCKNKEKKRYNRGAIPSVTLHSNKNVSKAFSSIFCCSMCNESFNNQIALLNHHRTHMSNKNNDKECKKEGRAIVKSHIRFAKVYNSGLINQDGHIVQESETRNSSSVGGDAEILQDNMSVDLANNKPRHDIDHISNSCGNGQRPMQRIIFMENRDDTFKTKNEYNGGTERVKNLDMITEENTDKGADHSEVMVATESTQTCKKSMENMKDERSKEQSLLFLNRRSTGILENINVGEVISFLRRNLTAMQSP